MVKLTYICQDCEKEYDSLEGLDSAEDAIDGKISYACSCAFDEDGEEILAWTNFRIVIE